MQARALTAYPINAFTGRELVGYEWRPVPDGCEAEARRLKKVGLVELQNTDEFTPPPGMPEDEPLAIVVNNDSFVVEPTLAVDLESLTIAELKDMAREAGVTVGRKNKAQLIDALKDD